MRRLLLAIAMLSAACGETGQTRVEATVFAEGGPTTFTAGLWNVTLTQAVVAVGPIYWCATAAASADLCPAATFELNASANFDATQPGVELGTGHGVTGELRSAAYDYGISWLTTNNQPAPTSGAIDGAHSAVFAGVATQGARTLAFSATLDVTPQLQGTSAVQGARSRGTVTDATTRVRITARPDQWFAAVDFDSAADVSATSVELTDASVAGNTVRIGMTANAPLTFTWEENP